ncbi:putative bifunctional diguanylate cyclase/phosphodiesterase [Asticcacaulis taihuensis]|uniref:putative bifunctional diguanylate cyclase/phosphodiesterase n=1 Tax=Asticcacaulis taihuensis TaxID=260084 RepID=UPI0026F057EC|nr:EAL domain-containing protein [Asticcacaulis taihuensis]
MASSFYPVRENEAQRVDALCDLKILDTQPEPEFEAVARLAQSMFNVPIALVCLLDKDRQWFKARCGLDVTETVRSEAFCNYPVALNVPFVVNDTWLDDRFIANELVTGSPHIRFYAGVPVSLQQGLPLGTICVIDREPRRFSDDDIRKLEDLALVVRSLYEQREKANQIVALMETQAQQTVLIKQQMLEISRQNRVFEQASKLAKIGAWEINPVTGDLVWTKGMYDIHGMSNTVPVDPEDIYNLYPPAVRKKLQKEIEKSNANLTGYTFEGPVILADGQRRWMRVSCEVEVEDGVIVRRYGMKQDITEQRELWDQTQFLATRDSLTGLSNRYVLRTSLDEAVLSPGGAGLRALFMIDLDGFKHVNDSFGHQAGDHILKTMGRRLRRCCRKSDIVARLGGDEFAILMSNVTDHAEFEAIARRLVSEFRKPVTWRSQSFQLSASVGLRIWNGSEAADADDVLSEADLALYAAKDSGKNTYHVYTPKMKSVAKRRIETVIGVATALNKDKLELFYQPKVALSTGAHVGFEALLRLRKADGSVTAPGEFEAALNDPELSRRIGTFVIDEAIRQAAEWRANSLAFGHIAVNLSGSEFQNDAFVHETVRKLQTAGLPPQSLEIEITERVFLNEDSDKVLSALKALKAAGVRIALDDFGTGFASLSHLRTFPVDVIKIDRTFVNGCLRRPDDNAIVQAILLLARVMELDVVAEGIEQEDELTALKSYGCGYGQGYLFSHPLPQTEAQLWLRALTTHREVA